MKKVLLSLLIASSVFMTGCSSFKSGKDVIIKVNDTNITKQMYDDAFNQSASSSLVKKEDKNSDKGRFLNLVMKDRIVNELVIKEMLEQEYKKMNITVSDEEMNKAMDKIYTLVGGRKNFLEGLKMSGATEQQYKEAVEKELKADKLLKKINTDKISDKDIEKYYNENKSSKFVYPDMVRASHILIMANEEEIKEELKNKNPKTNDSTITSQASQEMEKRKAKANAILAELKKDSSNFAKTAQKESEDLSSANLGGDLGFFAQQEVPEEFSKAAFNTKPGEMVDSVIQTMAGYHIIKVTDRKEAGVMPFEEVKGDIRTYLENEKKISSLQKYIDSLKSKTKVVYVDKSYDPAEIQQELKDVMKKFNKESQQTVKKDEKQT